MGRHRNGGLRKRCACPRRNWARCPHPWHFSFKWKGVHYGFSLEHELGRRIEGRTDAETEAVLLLRAQGPAGKEVFKFRARAQSEPRP